MPYIILSNFTLIINWPQIVTKWKDIPVFGYFERGSFLRVSQLPAGDCASF